ncbi:hypothetical protein [Amycolatopsis alba]|uniref:Uncharacterized protein n=1 Tax=Amycolatopsis alba DSM 44262 TaxID=1125972 RepID=A0A229RDQ8_AMYAL|nr:hypothetical protein [Amycolatopsis alba]OXM44813.1 hypothetical protein CFP75_33365 [Amycolatopsis alba DSM 44262]
MRRRLFSVIAFCLLVVSQVVALAAPASAAGPSICQREPRDAVAQLCGDQDERMYGMFVTFTYPTPSYGAPPPFGYADFYNETQLFTDDAMTKSFAFGLNMHYIGSGTDFQPYWIDYTAGYSYNKIGARMQQPDGRLHTFMALPRCDNCATWDIYYDFALVGTTGTQPGPASHHLVTGWSLVDMSGLVALSSTSNRVMYLNGNKQFLRFAQVNTSTRAPAGNCAPGADPNYCFRFTTGVTTTGGSYPAVVSWDVTKPIVRPGSAPAQAQASTAAVTTGPSALELEQRAQAFADAKFGGNR